MAERLPRFTGELLGPGTMGSSRPAGYGSSDVSPGTWHDGVIMPYGGAVGAAIGRPQAWGHAYASAG